MDEQQPAAHDRHTEHPPPSPADQQQWLADRFAEHRRRLRAVAYRLLGSISEADDALQEAWLRASRADIGEVQNVAGWLTTIVTRVSLNLLRARRARREDALEVRMPNPIVSAEAGVDPEHEALLADAVGLALGAVLETLSPDERVAFVLHDMFGVAFSELAPVLERTPEAARQLASRGRRRVRESARTPDVDLGAQRRVVDAFFAAARDGDLTRLVSVLHPDVVLRSDGGPSGGPRTALVHGREPVASRAMMFAGLSPHVRPALINGVAGVVVAPQGRPVSVMAFTVRDGLISAIDALADPERLRTIDLSALDAAR